MPTMPKNKKQVMTKNIPRHIKQINSCITSPPACDSGPSRPLTRLSSSFLLFGQGSFLISFTTYSQCASLASKDK